MDVALLETVERETGPDPRWTVLWLHGLGADGHDFAPIVPELLRPDWPGIRFVFPHAPVRPVTLNGGVPMRAWYDIRNLSADDRADEEGVRESMREVDALIARERDRGVPAERLLLVGFSQGGAMALASGLRREAPVAGIAALSAYLPLASKTAAEMTPGGKATPVFMAHGTQDPVVPYMLGDETRALMQSAGYAVEWHSYPMPHSLCADEVADLHAFLKRVTVA